MIDRFSKSEELLNRANQLIPGGSHTYSKGADQSPKLGPKFISRGKGSHVWDVDGNEYLDWAMGLASVSLGHAYEPVLEAVRRELKNGSNFQCPSPIEVELADLFMEVVPSAQMVKYAKNGSTVTTAAVKLSRAHTGRKYVAVCADHGFFSYDDWYIGLKPNNSGVPKEVSDLTLSFRYNDIESLKSLFDKYPDQIACVILEPMEMDFPENGFLQQIKSLCQKNGSVFILDEMITGFRLDYPGAHRMLDVEPDLCTWGKGLANGFSTCILSGKKEIMELGGILHDRERVFLMSTTHGAETHSLAAAMESIRSHRRENSIERNTQTGLFLKNQIEAIVRDFGLEDFVTVKGHPTWQALVLRDEKKCPSDGYRTLVMQETAKQGVLFRGSFVPTISHTQEDLDKTIDAFKNVFDVYTRALNDPLSYRKFLVGDPVKPVFRKWNRES